MRNLSAALRRAASYFAFACALIVAAGWFGGYVLANVHAQQAREIARNARLDRLAFEEREVTCLANIVYHEARGENVGTQELVAKTVLAAVRDPSRRVDTVCGDAGRKGRFSALDHARVPNFKNRVWFKIWQRMGVVYTARLTMPRGWQCVRDFRASDDYLESLESHAIKRLGFTVEATGLKYFAAKDVPVGTRGKVTFYSPRGGCKHPTPTI